MRRSVGFLLLCIALNFGDSEANLQISPEIYDKHSLPGDGNSTTDVYLKFRINDVNLKEREEMLELDMWITMTWKDHRLKRKSEPENEADSEPSRIRRDILWVPDLTLYNNVFDNSYKDHSSDLLIVYPSGLVLYVFPTKLQVSCLLDMTYWPYDTQICKTKFGSWVYDGYKMNLHLREEAYTHDEDEAEVDRSDSNGRGQKKNRTQWEVTSANIIREEKFYACCDEPYPSVELTLELKRAAPAFYSIVQKPAFALSLLTTVVFLMPPGAVEKLVVGTLNAMLNIQFLAYVSEKVEHPLHHTPLIISFLTDQVIFSVVIVFLSALIIRIAKDPHPQSLPEGFRNYLSYAVFGCCLSNYRNSESVNSCSDGDEMELEGALNVRSKKTGEGSPYAGSFSYFVLAAVIDRILFFIFFVQTLVYAARFCHVLF